MMANKPMYRMAAAVLLTLVAAWLGPARQPATGGETAAGVAVFYVA